MIDLNTFVSCLTDGEAVELMALLQQRAAARESLSAKNPAAPEKPSPLGTPFGIGTPLAAPEKPSCLGTLFCTEPAPEGLLVKNPLPVAESLSVKNSAAPEKPFGSRTLSGTSTNSPLGTLSFCAYLRQVWDWKNSEYLKEERLYGRHISKRHSNECLAIVRRYYQPYFGEQKSVGSVTKVELENFFLYLKLNLGLSGSTVNHAIAVASRAFFYLEKKQVISSNPVKNIESFCSIPSKRGIPTETEIRRLLKLQWPEKRTYYAFKLAAFFGIRAGEISALRVCDIDEQKCEINIRHSWNPMDGLKCTKNSECRKIPCEKKLLHDLILLAKKNPLYNEESFVFWSCHQKGLPCQPAFFTKGFYSALRRIGVSSRERCRRNLVFHSLRHFCASILCSQADIKTVQDILGHKTASMTEHYGNHSTEHEQVQIRRALSKSRKCILKNA